VPGLALALGLILLAGCQSRGEFTCPGGPIEVVESRLTPGDLARLAQAPATNSEREILAHHYLAQQCSDITSYRIPTLRQQSHVCVLPGASDKRIVVGAHYDKADEGDGVVDNWTGIVLTAKLLAYFQPLTPGYTWEFAVFGEEEPGMVGSGAFLREHRHADDIIAMVNIDTFGIGPVTVDRRSDKSLECLAGRVGAALDIDVRFNRLTETTGDWAPFRGRGISVLNLNSLDRAGLRVIHSRRDRLDAVDEDRMRETYRFLVTLLVNLDQQEFVSP